MFDYWATRRGLKRGVVPQPVALLYRQYVRFCQSYQVDDILSRSQFRNTFQKLTYTFCSYKGRQCILANKSLVPASWTTKLTKRDRQKKRPQPDLPA